MLTKITLVIALCSNANVQSVQSKLAELKAHNPDAQVSFRVDKKAVCTKDGMILTGKEAKLAEALRGGK